MPKKEMINQKMGDQLSRMADVFLTHRRMGEAEAIYRLDPAMHLSDSNIKCVFVPTGWPEERFVFAQKVSNDASEINELDDPSIYKIKDREGMYQEAATLLSKYERRGTKDNLDKLCYAQFCKEYDSCRKRSNKSK